MKKSIINIKLKHIFNSIGICILMLLYICCGIFVAHIFGVITYTIVWFATIIIWPIPLMILFGLIMWSCLAVYNLSLIPFLNAKIEELTHRKVTKGEL
jgi:hypothetical protein